MNQSLRALFIGSTLSVLSFATFSQKVFHVSFKFPAELNTEKIKIFYLDGKEFKKIKGPFINNQISISDSFFSRFANIVCFYYKTPERSSFGSSFFVWDTSAAIIFNESKDTLTSPFLNYKLTNAYNVDSTDEARRLTSFTSVEEVDYDVFLDRIGNNNSDSLNELKRIKYRKVMKKQLDFISQNGNQYYSLWFFKGNLFQFMDDFLTADSLLEIFEISFTPELKNSFEGKQVESILKGKISISNNDYAHYFKSVDINNKPVDLNSFKGKYILINFWASWCGPCIAELPTIHKLNNLYGKNKLTIISVSIDKDKQAFIKAVKKYKINWINILHDIDLENTFLKTGAIPQVYLIGPDGKLIYSREEQKDYDLKKLTSILEHN
jgi:thiol-disulfide isomerase/thioredoxin